MEEIFLVNLLSFVQHMQRLMMSFLLTILFQNHINESTNEFYVLSLFIIQY